MEQLLEYRGIRYLINHEEAGRREWIVYRSDGPADAVVRGTSVAISLRGSFKEAVHAARQAIDALLDGSGRVSPEETCSPAARAPG